MFSGCLPELGGIAAHLRRAPGDAIANLGMAFRRTDAGIKRLASWLGVARAEDGEPADNSERVDGMINDLPAIIRDAPPKVLHGR